MPKSVKCWVPLLLTWACASTPARPLAGSDPAPAVTTVPSDELASGEVTSGEATSGEATLAAPSDGAAALGATTAPPPSGAPAASATATSAQPPAARCGLPERLLARGWPRRLAPLVAERPFPETPGAVTLAVIPDTQYYALCRSEHLATQLDWIRDQGAGGNIQAALTLGDLTESNTPEEWRFVEERFRPLQAQMPVTLATGNHDYGNGGTANVRSTLFQEYFSVLAPKTREVLVETQRPFDLENAYYRIPLGKVTLGVLVLEWTPRSAAVAWANAVLKRYSKDRVIFITHAYLYHDNTRYDWWRKGEEQEWNPLSYGTARRDPDEPITRDNLHPEGAYDGEMLWQALVRRHPGIFLTLNGHVLADGAGLLSSRGWGGNVVHQVLVNYQMLDEGGLGFLRLLELLPDGETLRMLTYSPSLERYATAPDQSLELSISPPLW